MRSISNSKQLHHLIEREIVSINLEFIMARLLLSSSPLILLLFQFSTTFLPFPTSASSILFFHVLATSSHRTSIWPLVERLADKGHNITYVFPAENRDGTHSNVEEVVPSKMLPILSQFVGDFDINFRLNNTIQTWMWRLFGKCVDLCEAFYDSPEVHQWLARPGLKYDLVLYDSALGECVYGLVHRFKAKHVMFAPVLPEFIWDGFGIVPESSSIPEFHFHGKPTEMGVYNRLKTTIAPFLFRMAYFDYLRKIDPIVREKLNDPGMPYLGEFERNTSLILLNTHFIEDYPRALPPMMVSYSGLWCSKDKRDKERKPLPQDISAFINQGEDQGFIYVSFGSAVLVSGLPKEIIDKYFAAFAAFPKIKFLWRWKGEVPENTPKNVMLKPWFPQRDLLANPKVKLFITQAGRPSTQEALCFGVPMLTFPIFADQDINSDRLEYLGIAISYDINTFTTESLQSGIKELLHNQSYTNKVKQMSAMFRDRPIDPVDNALYWTEYVLRHDTSYLKPLGMKQRWWQRRLLDIYAVLFAGIVTVVGVSFIMLYFTVKLIFKLSMTTKDKRD